MTEPATVDQVTAALADLPEPDNSWATARKPARYFGFPVTVVVYGRGAQAFAEKVQAHLNDALAPARVLDEDQADVEMEWRSPDA